MRRRILADNNKEIVDENSYILYVTLYANDTSYFQQNVSIVPSGGTYISDKDLYWNPLTENPKTFKVACSKEQRFASFDIQNIVSSSKSPSTVKVIIEPWTETVTPRDSKLTTEWDGTGFTFTRAADADWDWYNASVSCTIDVLNYGDSLKLQFIASM